ncbi:putative pumilio homolog 8, chloroplastic [Durio zibethinus]|uniref:Pumilio homolog 8, chloroplastic n=1 Tax=Durio zibethinus TaxID=66656 RepID=A0A6P6AV67_DURZI|nr:putative pumilio homolog 8, chloroplastic [Durio zibethinus]
MEAVQGSRSFFQTKTFGAPVSRSPESYLPLYHNLEPVFAETSVQYNLFEENPFDQALESGFSRLNVSTKKNQEFRYPSVVGGELFEGSGYGFGGGLARTELERNNVVVEGLNVGFDGVMRMGPDIDSWDTVMSSSHQPSNLNRNWYLFDSRRNELFNEFSMVPSFNPNGLAAAAAGAGCSRASCSNNKNNNNNNNNQTNNCFRRHHWLQEPLNFLSLSDLRGRFVSLAKDQYSCRFLQRVIGGASKEEIDMIFMEIIHHVGELMLDPFANYVVQKVVDVCSEEQRSQILLMVVKDGFQLVNICLNVHGTRAVQKLLEKLTTQQQISLVMSALSPGAVALTKDMNGHHVIQYCLKNFSYEDNKYLLNEVADNCYQIATDKSGCFALQQSVDHSKGEARALLVREIMANALHLAEDQYGNYVVQHILGLKEPQITESLLRQLEGNFASLSWNRYGSNVVEKCLVESGEQQSTRIIMELLSSPIVSMLLVDPFGNYVMQTALSVSKGFVYHALLNLVRVNSPMMRSHNYGKWVLAWLDKRKLLHM